MISLNEYLADPCGTLSIPYWKAISTTIPENMEIFHNRDYRPDSWRSHLRYFRLLHDLKSICKSSSSPIQFITARECDLETIISIINQSYSDIQVTAVQMESYRKTPAFAPDLWVLAVHPATNECVGCGIADLDEVAGELILEWIQVLPQFRRQGVGQAIVNELLRRGQGKAHFATVSGRADDPSSPESLYRSCGFTGNDIWHICRK